MIKTPSNQRKWYVITTRSRSEKKVYANLKEQNIECFLPLQKKLRQWKDRKKWIEIPVISGYCFVFINPYEYIDVLNTKNVYGYVRFEGKPARISQKQIDSLKKMLNQTEFEVEVTTENFSRGKLVEIIEGPLIGIQGELHSLRGKHKFMLRIQQMNTIYAIEITADKLTALPAKKKTGVLF